MDLQAVCGSYFSTPGVYVVTAKHTHTHTHTSCDQLQLSLVIDEVNADKPRLLYALYFNITLNSFHGDMATPIDGLPRNVYLTSDPSAAIGFEGTVGEARSIFERMCPGEEFLPTPPDPRDIIYDQPSQQMENNTDPQDTTNTTDPQDTADTTDTTNTTDPQDTAEIKN